MTKVEPPIPMKKRKTVNPVALLTSPVKAVGIALQRRMIPIGIRGPYLSQKGPSKNLITIVPDTAAMEEDQICSLLNPKSTCISESKGVMENLYRKVRGLLLCDIRG